ncbi:shikimate kinase [Brevibacillus humidisoli]|uniref:shikimate kinase n=1 Tax=Brevibacillus humidisoli TaxID=2895522 RepID=UPI001E2D7D61|nr:shikimate kinase [Brevibacillus humidisoli]UFJ42951.1 shikimate kinase [Brevibacillus humidisoli]
MNNIILIGFMGTGKTTVGKALAQRLGRPYLDLDQYIVEREQRSIPTIFSEEGETYFRQVEAALLLESLQPGGRVITTGGGVVLRPDNVAAMKSGGWVIALKASPDEIIRRVSSDSQRPLLAGDAAERVHRLLAERDGMYDFAPLQIDTTGRHVQEIVDEIMRKMVEQTDFRRD